MALNCDRLVMMAELRDDVVNVVLRVVLTDGFHGCGGVAECFLIAVSDLALTPSDLSVLRLREFGLYVA